MQVVSAQTIQAEVISITAVTDFVNVVKLQPLTKPSYLAGQYLQIVLSDEDKRIFSIASCPDDQHIELHIGAGPDDAYPRGALDHMANNDVVTLEIGLGNAFYQEKSVRPIILMAGGTGFSYARSIAEHIKNHYPERNVTFYWGAKDEESLYASDEMKIWAKQNPNFTYVPVIEEATAEWQGKTGYVHQAVMADFASLEAFDVYLAGPFKMAGIAREDFVKHGAVLEHLYADAFAFI
ncbi:NAD(P)H-flavin reductase [Psychrosphaera sp. 1_MG-2023]|uniref:NAD(P)H-flavin reductase n=1 Tax=Psychrosphaera sp. 1_MG-2023 TaxID=3062643 RepID=UPI0026E19171|nr:NAD(P)H-flavin reductase [Psychrosphaera sp. 1_MG-2023]MDO6719676.1 NAD(P)H-flavin reductase [Psychrosphaera sp. 1_MG-2023]